MLFELLQEATADETSAYRASLTAAFERSDKIESKATKAALGNLKNFQSRLADELVVMQGRSELRPERMEATYQRVRELTRVWSDELLADQRTKYFGQAYKIGERVAADGLTATGYKLPHEPSTDEQAQALGSFLQSDISAQATNRMIRRVESAAMKIVRQHVLAGRDWATIEKELRRPDGIYWGDAVSATQNAVRTWQAEIQTRGTQKKLEEFSDRTGGAVRMMYVAIVRGDQTCARCHPHDGQVYDVRDGQAPKIPRHIGCRCSYVPHVKGYPVPAGVTGR